MIAEDYRNNRMEDAIEKLTEVSSDLNKVIAVHEQRLNQQEKQMGNLETVVEKRREESEIKLKDVYDTIRSEDRSILEELNNMRQEASIQHEKLQDRITLMEQKIWMYAGAISVLFFFISYGPSLLKLFGK
jgi:chromosome segregation ATPase